MRTSINMTTGNDRFGIGFGSPGNGIEHIYATDPSTEQVSELPVGGLLPANSVMIPDYLEIKTLDFTIDSNGEVTSGPLWSQVSGAGDPAGTKKTVLAKVTDSDGNIHTLPLTKFYEAPNVPPSYTFAGCGDDGKIRLIQEGSYANAWVYTEFDFDSDIGYLSAEIGYPGNLTTTAKTNLVAAINEVNGKTGCLVIDLGDGLSDLMEAAFIASSGNPGEYSVANMVTDAPTMAYLEDICDRAFAGMESGRGVMLKQNSTATFCAGEKVGQVISAIQSGACRKIVALFPCIGLYGVSTYTSNNMLCEMELSYPGPNSPATEAYVCATYQRRAATIV